jgi:hypothetical protein
MRTDTKKQFVVDEREGELCGQLCERLADRIGKPVELVVGGRKWRDEPVSEMRAQLGPGGYVIVLIAKEVVRAEWKPPAAGERPGNIRVQLTEDGREWEMETGPYARVDDLRASVARERGTRVQNIRLRQEGNDIQNGAMARLFAGKPIEVVEW